MPKEANGILRFIIKSQKWYNLFLGTNGGVARDLRARWKICLSHYTYFGCSQFQGEGN